MTTDIVVKKYKRESNSGPSRNATFSESAALRDIEKFRTGQEITGTSNAIQLSSNADALWLRRGEEDCMTNPKSPCAGGYKGPILVPSAHLKMSPIT